MRRTPASPGFNLREVWEKAYGREESEDHQAIEPSLPRLRVFGISPEIPLRLVLLLTDPSARVSDGAILKLQPSDVRSEIRSALRLIDQALEFLTRRISLIPHALPDANYLLPVALAARQKPAVFKTERLMSALERWWWAAVFSAVFGRGRTGDIVPKESSQLVSWLVESGDEPDHEVVLVELEPGHQVSAGQGFGDQSAPYARAVRT